MDESAIAFGAPHVRAAATQGAELLDRISVRDYTRAVEIGAFRSERGVTQRLRFNVVLEVSHSAAARDDDVDKVISYDTITDAIDALLAAERINLLETLAERVAGRCLADARAVRVFVRIEKLDRIPGTLGVEIVRMRVPDEAPRLRPVEAVGAPLPDPRARVVFAGAGLAGDPAWRDVLAAGGPVVICPAPGAPQPSPTSEARLRIGLLAIEQAAWALSDADARFDVCATRTELDWALKGGKSVLWAPAKMVTDARNGAGLDANRPAELAAWLARELGAETLILAGAAAEAPVSSGDVVLQRIARPQDFNAKP